MSVFKRGRQNTHWHYYFRVRGVRYRGAIPEARTKWEAEQAESKIRQEVFEGRFGLVQSGTMKLTDFIEEIYMPWAKANKRKFSCSRFRKPRPRATTTIPFKCARFPSRTLIIVCSLIPIRVRRSMTSSALSTQLAGWWGLKTFGGTTCAPPSVRAWH